MITKNDDVLALSERLLQLANDEGTAQTHDVAIKIAALVSHPTQHTSSTVSAEMVTAGAMAMVVLGRTHREATKPLPSRTEEARACLEAALGVGSGQEPPSKRPVAFRVPRAVNGSVVQWRLYESEEEARAMADTDGVEYQGLYVRNGSAERTPAERQATIAIQFAVAELEDDFERLEFLECWLLGKLDQWPDFEKFSASRSIERRSPAAPAEAPSADESAGNGDLTQGVRWAIVNDEPFEYAIQLGPHGDEFVKLLNGECLRRPTSRIPGGGDGLHRLTDKQTEAVWGLTIDEAARKIEKLESDLAAAKEEAESLQATFDLQWKADQRASGWLPSRVARNDRTLQQAERRNFQLRARPPGRDRMAADRDKTTRDDR